MPPDAPPPLLPEGPLAALRGAVAGFTADAVAGLLGPAGTAAQRRGDLLGVARALDGTAAEDAPLATLVRLFLLGEAVPRDAAREALEPLPLGQAAPLLGAAGDGEVRATVELRPHAADGRDFWVVSDFGSDVRPGPLGADHVLGIGAASLTLARATVRLPVRRALDLGTGCGVQALHLSGHAEQVVATDVSARALRFAATTAALNGMSWDLREGSLLAPVAGERFDLVVANPPFVVSPGLSAGDGGHSYRDSGLAGDGVTERLLRGVPDVLTDTGSAQVLANWIVPPDGDWAGRLADWLAGSRCDAWVWQREVADPGEYVSLWLRDAGESPGTPSWRAQYTRWLDWFAAAGVAAVGMGLVALWRSGLPRGEEILRFEDVPQQIGGPAGALLPGWIERQRWLAGTADAALLAARLRAADDTRLVAVSSRASGDGGPGWRSAELVLRQDAGMRWELVADEPIATLVGACDGSVPLGVLLGFLAATLDADEAAVTDGALPVVRDLVARGFLEREAG